MLLDKKLSQPQGFTLIELLVVMAVMSILVGVGVNTFSIAQKKARDTKRKADLRTIQMALETWKIEKGMYPPYGSDYTQPPQYGNYFGWAIKLDCNDALDDFLVNGRWGGPYLKSLPDDPLNPTHSYYYKKIDDENYVLGSYLEDSGDKAYTTPSTPYSTANCVGTDGIDNVALELELHYIVTPQP